MENEKDLREKLEQMTKEELVDFAVRQTNVKNTYMEIIMSMNNKTFKKKTETLDHYQISLFDEIESTYEQAIPEELDESLIQPKPKKKKRTKTKETDYSNLEKKTIYHTISDKVCPFCGDKLVQTGQKVIEVLKYQKAYYYIEQHIICEYACNSCGKEEIVSDDAPVRLLERSKVSSSVVAGIVTNKFVLDVPLYRQENDLKRQGIYITRQNMSNWLIQSCEFYLEPLFEKMHKDIQDLDIIHMDETTHICIEDKKDGREKSYEWMIVSGAYEEKQMALYFYSESRRYDTMNDLLRVNPKRYIQSDGYGAYHNEEYGTDVACIAHIRRKFYDAMITDPLHSKVGRIKDKDEAKALIEANPSYKNIVLILNLIKKISNMDQKIKNRPLEERLKMKEDGSLPIFNELYEMIESLQNSYLPQSKMGKAITYAINEKEYLKNYYLDGRLEISNNRAERMIKDLVMARKNFLFSNTARGARTSSIYMSLIESAKLNNLDPYRYLIHVLDHLSKEGLRDEIIEEVLPYSEFIPKSVKVHR